MKKLKFIISKYEKSYEAALAMKNNATIETEIVYIEDIVTKKLSFTDDDIVHFSCNSEETLKIIKENINKKCYIFNKKYLLNNYSKLKVQQLFSINDIKVPKIYLNYEDIKLPIFCKENKHTGILFQAYRKNTLDRFFTKFDIKDFYFEESLSNNGLINKEFKIYVVDNKIFGSFDNKLLKRLNEICGKIKIIFNDIDIYSADFIEINDKLYLIDFNPAVGFYLTEEGRSEFLKLVDQIAKQ